MLHLKVEADERELAEATLELDVVFAGRSSYDILIIHPKLKKKLKHEWFVNKIYNIFLEKSEFSFHANFNQKHDGKCLLMFIIA